VIEQVKKERCFLEKTPLFFVRSITGQVTWSRSLCLGEVDEDTNDGEDPGQASAHGDLAHVP
jgi:hypothetical protein